MTRAEMRESLALLPSWVLAQKAAANRQLVAVMRQRLAAGEQVARMYQEPGLAWLQRQGEAAEQLLAEWQAGSEPMMWRVRAEGSHSASRPLTDRPCQAPPRRPAHGPYPLPLAADRGRRVQSWQGHAGAALLRMCAWSLVR